MFPLLIEIGDFHLGSYWVSIVLGALIAAVISFTRRRRMGFQKDETFWLLANVMIFSIFIGGRLGFLVRDISFSDPDFFAYAFHLKSGFSVQGGILGALVGVLVFCRVLGLDFLRLGDYLAQVTPIIQSFGRLGCFAAGCCYGQPPRGRLAWAITFTDPRSSVPSELLGRPLHPTQLYESLAGLALAALLYGVLRGVENGKLRPGSVVASYFASYAAIRFILEFFRGDSVALGWGLTGDQGVSLVFLTVAVVVAVAAWRRPCIPS